MEKAREYDLRSLLLRVNSANGVGGYGDGVLDSWIVVATSFMFSVSHDLMKVGMFGNVAWCLKWGV